MSRSIAGATKTGAFMERYVVTSILSAMPFAIILYLRVCNPGYMDALYGNIPGAALMTVCLGIIVATVLWGRKIININV